MCATNFVVPFSSVQLQIAALGTVVVLETPSPWHVTVHNGLNVVGKTV